LTWLWSTGETTASITVNPSQTTFYTVTGTDATGCTNTDTVFLYVPSLTLGSNLSVCQGSSIGLSVGITGIPSGMIQPVYQWSPASSLNNPFAASPVATPSVTTIYTVVVTDPLTSCSYSGQVVVFVLPRPVVSLGPDLALAPGSTVNLSPSLLNTGQGPQYQWTLLAPFYGSLAITNTRNTQFTANSLITSAVNQQVVLSVTSSSGCQGSDTVVITIDPLIGGYTLSGIVQYANAANSPINEGSVWAYGPSGHYRVVPIGPGGTYFMNGMQDSTYRIQARVTKAWGGVTVADAQLINENVLFSGLTGIYQFAADVSGDGRFLANDAQQTARRAAELEITNSFDNGSGPGNWYQLRHQVTISGSNATLNPKAVSYGDVNGSYSPVLRNSTTLVARSGLELVNEETVKVPVTLDQELVVGSYQVDLIIPVGYRVEEVLNPLVNGEFMYKVSQNRVRILWYKTTTASARFLVGDLLFTLVLKRLEENQGGIVALDGFHEFNDASANPYGLVRLVIPNISSKTDQPEIQLYPNPSSGMIYLKLNSKNPQAVTLRLTDLAGKETGGVHQVFAIGTGEQVLVLDVTGLAAGQYMLHGTGEDDTFRFVKRFTLRP
jgi:hypothetical protein